MFFTRVRPFEIDLQFLVEILTPRTSERVAMYDVITGIPTSKILTEKNLQIDSKWSETRKKHETTDKSPVAVSTDFTSRKC